MIINGNALNIPLADKSVQCVVTSPPYWGLRDYGTARWIGGNEGCDHNPQRPDGGDRADRTLPLGRGGMYRDTCAKCGAVRQDAQLGLEATPEEYVANMVAVFREVRRVLRDDGTCWLNLGNSYASQTKGSGGPTPKQASNSGSFYNVRHLDHGLKDKDLVGIPWRVAFALQQPYENVLIADRVWRAWIAGIIDGEGCITVHEVTTSVDQGRAVNPSYPIVVQVRMSDRQALERIVELTGVSKVQDEHLSPSQIDTLQRAPSCWKTSGDNAKRILAEIYPYLTVKRLQALVAWNLQKLKDGVETKRGVPIPRENVEKRKLLFEIIRDLNQRRAVDIPSWLDEPTIDIEPGWYLRSDVIWSKPNPMPESVTDRPTKAHEYVFLLTKQARYYYDADAVREPITESTIERGAYGWNGNSGESLEVGARSGSNFKRMKSEGMTMAEVGMANPAGRNRRTVWTIATQPYSGAHFATFPEALVEPCILAGTSERGCCPVCGKPWKRVVDATPSKGTVTPKAGTYDKPTYKRAGFYDQTSTTIGWQPACTHDAAPIPCTVFDPFSGTATVGVVAQRHGRKFVGLELSMDYIWLAKERLLKSNGYHAGRMF